MFLPLLLGPGYPTFCLFDTIGIRVIPADSAPAEFIAQHFSQIPEHVDLLVEVLNTSDPSGISQNNFNMNKYWPQHIHVKEKVTILTHNHHQNLDRTINEIRGLYSRDIFFSLNLDANNVSFGDDALKGELVVANSNTPQSAAFTTLKCADFNLFMKKVFMKMVEGFLEHLQRQHLQLDQTLNTLQAARRNAENYEGDLKCKEQVFKDVFASKVNTLLFHHLNLMVNNGQMKILNTYYCTLEDIKNFLDASSRLEHRSESVKECIGATQEKDLCMELQRKFHDKFCREIKSYFREVFNAGKILSKMKAQIQESISAVDINARVEGLDVSGGLYDKVVDAINGTWQKHEGFLDLLTGEAFCSTISMQTVKGIPRGELTVASMSLLSFNGDTLCLLQQFVNYRKIGILERFLEVCQMRQDEILNLFQKEKFKNEMLSGVSFVPTDMANLEEIQTQLNQATQDLEDVAPLINPIKAEADGLKKALAEMA